MVRLFTIPEIKRHFQASLNRELMKYPCSSVLHISLKRDEVGLDEHEVLHCSVTWTTVNEIRQTHMIAYWLHLRMP